MRRFALLLLLLSAVGRSAGADPAAELTADEKALFAWWDSLGYPDVTKLPFVRVAKARYSVGPEFAFQVAETPETVTLFTTTLLLDHRPRAITESKIESVDLIAYVEEGISKLRARWIQNVSINDPDPFLAGPNGRREPERAYRLFALARACAGRGRPDLAHDLCGRLLWGQHVVPGDPFVERKREMAAGAMRAALLRVRDESASWADVRVEFERLAKRFPAHEGTTAAAADLATLDRMAGEVAPVDDGTVASRIEGLLYGLRSRFDLWDPRWPDAAPKEGHPLKALLAIGPPAVERLRVALDDRTLTRTVQYYIGRWGYGDRIALYRVSDAAIDVLDAMSKGAIRGSDDYGRLHLDDPKQHALVKERVAAWIASSASDRPR